MCTSDYQHSLFNNVTNNDVRGSHLDSKNIIKLGLIFFFKNYDDIANFAKCSVKPVIGLIKPTNIQL